MKQPYLLFTCQEQEPYIGHMNYPIPGNGNDRTLPVNTFNFFFDLVFVLFPVFVSAFSFSSQDFPDSGNPLFISNSKTGLLFEPEVSCLMPRESLAS